ncbi:MAG TPA: GNAT family N-acetyltransferase [Clostridiales bacterium]|nr:GNAT family N-acetyltransferase [Clostridiales bacterium]
MKDKAVNYLMKNQLLHIDMLEPIRKNTADILYADSEGVLIKELKSGAYMISADTLEKGREVLKNVSECDLIVAHQPFMVDYIQNKFGLKNKTECIQAVYTDKDKLEGKSEIEIRQLDIAHIDVVLKHYKLLSGTEIEELLKAGSIFGGYKDTTLIGFVGLHLEGSLGLLEIFPEHRRKGYAMALESYMINKVLAAGGVPYAQIKVNNKASIKLQRKLGLRFSEDRLCWMF